MQFEWDEVKSKTNFSKHGIDFAYAARLFNRAHTKVLSDYRAEQRYLAIGEIEHVCITVIFTFRGKNLGLK